MFRILLTSSVIVWPIICNNLYHGSICVERFLVTQFFCRICGFFFKYCVICNSYIEPERLPLFQKVSQKKTHNSSNSMISNFNNRPVVKVTLMRSVLISEVCRCNSFVDESGEYNPNWSYLFLIANLSGTHSPAHG